MKIVCKGWKEGEGGPMHQECYLTPTLQAVLATCWLLQPRREDEFYLYTDYSGYGIGACLM